MHDSHGMFITREYTFTIHYREKSNVTMKNDNNQY